MPVGNNPVGPDRRGAGAPAVASPLPTLPPAQERRKADAALSHAAFTLRRADVDAVLFDLDGVITRTAGLHAQAWKQMFDAFLERWNARTGETQAPFDAVEDYRRYLDGLPRDEGVKCFLFSRGITLPLGGGNAAGTDRADSEEIDTVHALGQRKTALFDALLREQAVPVYASSVALLGTLAAAGFRLAVVSSSAHCSALLASAGLQDAFDAQVDGNDLERFHLRGKPAPDAYLEAARRLGIPAARAVVVEDAIAGVQAGHAGGFGAVVGVDRMPETPAHAQALRRAGATVVVTDLAALAVEGEA